MRVLVPITAVLLTVLAGCAPSPAPSSTPTAAPPESATPSATPEPTAEALVIPNCEALMPLALAQSSFGDNVVFFGEVPVAEFPVAFEVSGADAVLAGASQSRGCYWGIPNSDGSFSIQVAEVTPAERSAVEGALGTAGFSSVTMGTVTGFDLELAGMEGEGAATHLFTGDVWILASGSYLGLTGIVAGAALDGMRTANPTLDL